MGRLYIVKQAHTVESSSTEVRYAFVSTLREARRVFAEVEVADADAAAAAVGPADYVLSITEPGIFLSGHSLASMRARLGQPGDTCVSVPIQQFDLSGCEPIQTPSAYGLLERQLLQRLAEVAPEPGAGHPVTLMGGAAFLRSPGADSDSAAPAVGGVHFKFSDYYGSERRDLLPFIAAGVRDVLEIGCASGRTGEMLRRERGCRVTGVEPNPEIAACARERLDAVLQGELQSLHIEGSFDLVIAADVLEHQGDPAEFLQLMWRCLRPGGQILLSTPNVGHYSLVQDLLAGRWDYVPQGLLCVTHLRFFTRRTLEDLFSDCGFAHYAIHPQPVSQLPERFASLATALELDEESLATPGFYVVIQRPPEVRDGGL